MLQGALIRGEMMGANADLFQYCPRCGRHGVTLGEEGKALSCAACGWLFFLNPASAVGAIMTDPQGRVLLLRRMRDPGKGKFGLPGGFIDSGESVEEALRREVREEVGLELAELRYLCSFPNQYCFRDVTYPVVDLFFVCTARSMQLTAADDEVESICFLHPQEIDLEQVAFPSVRAALRLYRNTLTDRHRE